MANDPVQFEVRIPEETRPGTYANFMTCWHTAYEFTLDFAVTQPLELRTTEAGEQLHVVPADVVARVKVPPGLLFNIIRALNENMTLYEQAFGEIRRPGEDAIALPPDLQLPSQDADNGDEGPEETRSDEP